MSYLGRESDREEGCVLHCTALQLLFKVHIYVVVVGWTVMNSKPSAALIRRPHDYLFPSFIGVAFSLFFSSSSYSSGQYGSGQYGSSSSSSRGADHYGPGSGGSGGGSRSGGPAPYESSSRGGGSSRGDDRYGSDRRRGRSRSRSR